MRCMTPAKVDLNPWEHPLATKEPEILHRERLGEPNRRGGEGCQTALRNRGTVGRSRPRFVSTYIQNLIRGTSLPRFSPTSTTQLSTDLQCRPAKPIRLRKGLLPLLTPIQPDSTPTLQISPKSGTSWSPGRPRASCVSVDATHRHGLKTALSVVLELPKVLEDVKGRKRVRLKRRITRGTDGNLTMSAEQW